jgi:hypothetical protein
VLPGPDSTPSATHLVALSRPLGHHSPAFTLSRYTHLLPGETAAPLEIDTGKSALKQGPRR